MIVNENFSLDELTGLPNFTRFFTDDFSNVYGNKGYMLLFRIKHLKRVNELYGREMGDTLLQTLGAILSELQAYPKYRHEGNGMLLILKESCFEEAKRLKAYIKNEFEVRTEKYQIDFIKLYNYLMPYKKPIRSVADYYQLFYEQQTRGRHTDDAQLLHHVLEGLSLKVNDVIRQYGNFQDYALVDEVSNLPNSKCAKLFLETIDQKYENYAVLLIDGDNLRQYNTISYTEGNYAIRKIGEIIKNSIRKTDHVFRWLCGDEFLVVTSSVNKKDVEVLAERIRQNVEAYFSNSFIPTTVSLGVAFYPQNGDSITKILANAEDANKKAKYLGKNRIVCHEHVVFLP